MTKIEHGLASLLDWVMRKTGPGTFYDDIDRNKLIMFILTNKNETVQHLRGHDYDPLMRILLRSTNSGGEIIDWMNIIESLVRKGNLFKFPCSRDGLWSLTLCDRG